MYLFYSFYNLARTYIFQNMCVSYSPQETSETQGTEGINGIIIKLWSDYFDTFLISLKSNYQEVQY